MTTAELDFLRSIPMSALEQAANATIEGMKSCPHLDMQRWGPSYGGMPQGHYRKVDYQVCKGCGYNDSRI